MGVVTPLALLCWSAAAYNAPLLRPATRRRSAVIAAAAIATRLESYAEFEEALEACRVDDVLMIVEYTQPRCNACRAMSQKLQQLSDVPQHVRIFNVDTTSSGGREITASDGVPKALPRLDIYKEGVKAYGGVFTVRQWNDLMATLHYHGLPDYL